MIRTHKRKEILPDGQLYLKDLIRKIEPGEPVSHTSNFYSSRGIVISVVDDEVTVLWSRLDPYDPDPPDQRHKPWELIPNEVYDESKRWTVEEARRLLEAGHIKNYSMSIEKNGETSVELHRYDRPVSANWRTNEGIDGQRLR